MDALALVLEGEAEYQALLAQMLADQDGEAARAVLGEILAGSVDFGRLLAEFYQSEAEKLSALRARVRQASEEQEAERLLGSAQEPGSSAF